MDGCLIAITGERETIIAFVIVYQQRRLSLSCAELSTAGVATHLDLGRPLDGLLKGAHGCEV